VAPADGGREMTLLSPIVSARGREPPPCDPPCRSLIRGMSQPRELYRFMSANIALEIGGKILDKR